MSNKQTLQENNSVINDNNNDLDTIIEMINNLPEAGGGDIPEASILMQENGVYDVTDYTTAIVDVDEYEKMVLFALDQLESLVNYDITSVHNYGFAYKTALKTINLPNCTSLGSRAFVNCTGATSIHLPSVTTLGTYAFSNMSSLPSITFYNTIRVFVNMFDGCKALTKVILYSSTVCTLNNVSAFNNTPIASGTGYIYVPDNLIDSYKSATNWSTFANQIRGTSELSPPPEPEPF